MRQGEKEKKKGGVERALTRAGSVDFTDNVGHASFVAQESCEVDGFGWVIFGEALHLTTVPAAPLAR